jgi:hypothetical protein
MLSGHGLRDREIRPGGHSHTVTIDYADAGRFEWKGGGNNWGETAKGLFAQPRNLLSPSCPWKLRDILTFSTQSTEDYIAAQIIRMITPPQPLLRRALTDYPAPMGAAIWSRQSQDKLFCVSPFVEMAMRNHFRVSPPEERVPIADSRDRPRRPPAVGDLQWPPPRPDHGGAAAFVRLAAARHPEDRRGDPLGGAAALAQRRATGAAAECCTGEHGEYHLGERRMPRLYCGGVICRRAEARSAGKRSGPVTMGRLGWTQSRINRWAWRCLR